MDNRLTCSTLACPRWSLDQIIDRLAEAGVGGIDFRGVGDALDHTRTPPFTTAGRERTLARLRERGLSVPCMCSSVKLMTPDDAAWTASCVEYRRYLATADAFASPFVRIFPGQTPTNMPRDEAAALARRRARELAAIALKESRARPILETHDDWGASRALVTLLADCEPQAFPVVWDVRHTWAAGESPDVVIGTLGERLQHVHVKDAQVVDGAEVPCLLGAGLVTVGPALEALKAAGYEGWICLETEKRWRPETAPEPEESVPQFLAFVRSI